MSYSNALCNRLGSICWPSGLSTTTTKFPLILPIMAQMMSVHFYACNSTESSQHGCGADIRRNGKANRSDSHCLTSAHHVTLVSTFLFGRNHVDNKLLINIKGRNGSVLRIVSTLKSNGNNLKSGFSHWL